MAGNDEHLSGSRHAETARYFAAIREHWVLLLAVLGVAFASAAAVALTRHVAYAARAEVLVSPVDTSDQSLLGLGLLRNSTGSVFAAGRLVTEPLIVDRVMRSQRLSISRAALKSRIKVVPLQQSNIVSIEATAPRAREAAALANAFADALLAERTRVFQTRLDAELKRLTARRAALGTHATGSAERVAAALDAEIAYLTPYVGESDPTLEIWSPATPPDAPMPRSKAMIIATFFAALVIGSGVALVLEMLDGRIRGEADLDGVGPVLARVPALPGRAAERHLAGEAGIPSASLDAYRILRARVSAAGPSGSPPRSVLVTSAVESEGKTMTAVNLARAFAAAGEKVVLVDANVRKPAVGKAVGLPPPRRGLLALLRDEAAPADEALVPVEGGRRPILVLLPERDPSAAFDLLDGRRAARLIERLAPFGIVVIDAAGLTVHGEAVALAGACDSLLISVRLGYSDGDALAEASRLLRREEAPLTGYVVTARKPLRQRARGEAVEAVRPPIPVPAPRY